jgi:hypothetical protein
MTCYRDVSAAQGLPDFRLRTLAENPANLIAGVAYPAKNVIY